MLRKARKPEFVCLRKLLPAPNFMGLRPLSGLSSLFNSPVSAAVTGFTPLSKSFISCFLSGFMISICAEALALRRTFPTSLSDCYFDAGIGTDRQTGKVSRGLTRVRLHAHDNTVFPEKMFHSCGVSTVCIFPPYCHGCIDTVVSVSNFRI